MQELQPQQLDALSAHVEGLGTALAALGADASLSASLRRIARSLGTAAEATGATQLATLAHAIQDAADAELEGATRDLLDYVTAVRRAVPGEPVHVLVVEDNRTVAAAVLSYLAGEGRRVRHATTAAEAEAVLASDPVDVVVLDLILPDRDGRDLLVQLRESPATASLPVVVLSGKEGAVAKAECIAVGASEFIEKPADPAALRAAVMRHAQARRREGDRSHRDARGLLDRAGLAEAFRAARSGGAEGGALAVAILAVGELARVTQLLGEAARNRLLDAVAAEACSGLAEADSLGRWGAAELVALFPGNTSSEAKEKLKKGLSGLASSGGLTEYQEAGIAISFGAGVAVADPEQGFHDVVSAAERSLYRAMDSGQGVVLAPGDPFEARAPRILLVEDDRVTATLVHHRLVREDFEVMDFLNGEDAYQWARDADFDLAILDVKVPGMDGFELLERLRAIPRLASVPIVMLTGLGSEADVIRGLELGANDYMLKPFSPTELLARVRRLVHASPDAQPGADSGTEDPAEAGPH